VRIWVRSWGPGSSTDRRSLPVGRSSRLGNAACVQAVTAGAFDRQPVFLRADMNGFGFDAGQVDKDDVFVGEFADVDLGDHAPSPATSGSGRGS
jgi:hypothetical protein